MSKPHFAYPGQPSEDLVELYHATLAYLKSLVALLKPAQRRPDAPATPEAIDFARFVLADAVRVTSRLHGPKLLPLGQNITNAGLALRLGMADAALGQFRARYHRAPILTAEEQDEIVNPADVWWTNEYLEECSEIAAPPEELPEADPYEAAMQAWTKDYLANCDKPGFAKKPRPVAPPKPPVPLPVTRDADTLPRHAGESDADYVARCARCDALARKLYPDFDATPGAAGSNCFVPPELSQKISRFVSVL